jgi:hypothetical protein
MLQQRHNKTAPDSNDIVDHYYIGQFCQLMAHCSITKATVAYESLKNSELANTDWGIWPFRSTAPEITQKFCTFHIA